MLNYNAIFRSISRKKKNRSLTRRAIKSELIIPKGASEISQYEMEYINGGTIEINRYGFLGYFNYFIFGFEAIQIKIAIGKSIFKISEFVFFTSFIIIIIIDFIYLIKTKNKFNYF